MRKQAALVLGVALALLSGAAPARAQHSPRGQVLVGGDVGVVGRPAASNPDGTTYGAALGYGAHVQVLAAKWLRFTAYYLHSSHEFALSQGALHTGAEVTTEDAHLSSYVLGLRAQPTWNVTERTHLWLSVGAGWGKLHAPKLRVAAPSPYEIAPRESVFVELPLGIGACFDVIPRWLGIGGELFYAPMTNQSGDLLSNAQSIDGAGKIVQSGPFPQIAASWGALVNVAMEL